MKTFILCGGFGTRLDDLGTVISKSMVRIGSKPILMEIIQNYTDQGFDEFVFCLGHKANTVIDYFLKENKKKTKIISQNKNLINFHYKDSQTKFLGTLIYTGLRTGTGGRIKRAYKDLKLEEDIMMTYGDGLSNVSIKKLINFHYKMKAIVTLTAVRPKERYGILKITNNKITYIDNNNKNANTYVNGGFFVINKVAINMIKKKSDFWEQGPLSYFAKSNKLFAFKHEGFWKSLDTLKDKKDFEKLNKFKIKPWKI